MQRIERLQKCKADFVLFNYALISLVALANAVNLLVINKRQFLLSAFSFISIASTSYLYYTCIKNINLKNTVQLAREAARETSYAVQEVSEEEKKIEVLGGELQEQQKIITNRLTTLEKILTRIEALLQHTQTIPVDTTALQYLERELQQLARNKV